MNEDEYVEGAPELLAEIAYSSVTIDMNQKKQTYQNSGILEYLVVLIEEQEVHWFDLANARSLEADQDGVIRSETFPGLWLDTKPLLAKDTALMLNTLERGLKSPEHAELVAKLEAHQ